MPSPARASTSNCSRTARRSHHRSRCASAATIWRCCARLPARSRSIVRNTPGARDVINPVANDGIDLDIGLDEDKAALLNIAPGEARRAIRLALSGENAAIFPRRGRRQLPRRRAPADRRLPADLGAERDLRRHPHRRCRRRCRRSAAPGWKACRRRSSAISWNAR